MAAWRSMSDDEYDVCESHGRDVRVTDDYDWDGDLDAESVAAAGLHEAIAEIDAILERAAAA